MRLFIAVLGLLLFLPRSTAIATIQGPISKHFQDWLGKNGYNLSINDFARFDLNIYGSFGGRQSVNDQVKMQPVIFIHGAGDTALASNSTAAMQTGWTNTLDHFLMADYIFAELYGTTWGDGIYANAPKQQIDCAAVIRMRRFIEAVILYTKSAKVDVISHSTGVALARKALKGGTMTDRQGTCNIGLPINNFVDTFLGLAGENFGMCNCLSDSGTVNKNEPICDHGNGFFPGNSCGSSHNCGQVAPSCEANDYSTFLQELNTNTAKEADYTFAFWTSADDFIGYNGTVWGRTTSVFSGVSVAKEYSKIDHVAVKDLTGEDQLIAVRDHVVTCEDQCTSFGYLAAVQRHYLFICLSVIAYFCTTIGGA